MKVFIDLIESALGALIENDSELLIRDVNERSVAFRLGVYLDGIISGNNEEWRNISVDAEYNKNGDGPKGV